MYCFTSVEKPQTWLWCQRWAVHLQISAHSPPLNCNPPGPAFIIHSKLVESISNRHDCTHGHLPGVTKQTFHSRCPESQRLSLSSIAGCYTRFNLDFSFFFFSSSWAHLVSVFLRVGVYPVPASSVKCFHKWKVILRVCSRIVFRSGVAEMSVPITDATSGCCSIFG